MCKTPSSPQENIMNLFAKTSYLALTLVLAGCSVESSDLETDAEPVAESRLSLDDRDDMSGETRHECFMDCMDGCGRGATCRNTCLEKCLPKPTTYTCQPTD